MIKVCHISTVHDAYDSRISLRICKALADAGYDVYYVVPHPKEEIISKTKIIPLGTANKGRFYRFTIGALKALRVSLKVKAQIYHFHDPELIPIGILLVLFGKKVVYDVHEDVRKQILSKDWLPAKKLVSKIYSLFDWIAQRFFYIILAENSYEKYYENCSKGYEFVLNTPDLSFFQNYNIPDRQNLKNHIFYVGGVSNERGLDVTVKAVNILKEQFQDIHFHCVGPITDADLEGLKQDKSLEGVWSYVTLYDNTPLDKAYEISKQCKVGLAVLKPIPNYLESYSTKTFEYLAISLPVITSDFDIYKNIFEKNNCGWCIDSTKPEVLADCLKEVFTNAKKVEEFTKNGYRYVHAHFSWEKDKERLIRFYSKIIG